MKNKVISVTVMFCVFSGLFVSSLFYAPFRRDGPEYTTLESYGTTVLIILAMFGASAIISIIVKWLIEE